MISLECTAGKICSASVRFIKLMTRSETFSYTLGILDIRVSIILGGKSNRIDILFLQPNLLLFVAFALLASLN